METERRYKRLIISKGYIFNFFVKQNHRAFLMMPIFEGIPDDVVLVRVDYDLCCDGFSFMLFHPTFDIVPEYANIPVIEREQRIEFQKSDYKNISVTSVSSVAKI